MGMLPEGSTEVEVHEVCGVFVKLGPFCGWVIVRCLEVEIFYRWP